MSDICTHPNGYAISRDTCGSIRGEHDAGPGFWLLKESADALRDFLLDELGLWRDPETGALVVTSSWDGSGAYVLTLGGGPVYGFSTVDVETLSDAVVTRWRATLTPPPREPKPGEVWRITLDDGTSRNVLVQEYASGAVCFEDGSDGGWYVSGFPADRRRLLVEADGTVVSDE